MLASQGVGTRARSRVQQKINQTRTRCVSFSFSCAWFCFACNRRWRRCTKRQTRIQSRRHEVQRFQCCYFFTNPDVMCWIHFGCFISCDFRQGEKSHGHAVSADHYFCVPPLRFYPWFGEPFLETSLIGTEQNEVKTSQSTAVGSVLGKSCRHWAKKCDESLKNKDNHKNI